MFSHDEYLSLKWLKFFLQEQRYMCIYHHHWQEQTKALIEDSQSACLSSDQIETFNMIIVLMQSNSVDLQLNIGNKIAGKRENCWISTPKKL